MRKKMFILFLCIIFVLALGIFRYYHPTHYKYNDRFVIGTTEKNIVEKYGQFSRELRNEAGEILYGIYKIRDNTPELIMSYDNSLWYKIYFENGVAVRVELEEGWA